MADDDVVEATSRVAVTISPGEGYLVQEDAGSAAVFVADNDRHFLLPDLVSDAPTPWGEAEVVWWNGEEMLVLRFEGYVTNLGDGPLDLRGNPQLADPDDRDEPRGVAAGADVDWGLGEPHQAARSLRDRRWT